MKHTKVFPRDLVVKVCDTQEPGHYNSSLNEKSILESLESPGINKMVGFFTDEVLNKSYLVLEKAGE